MTERLPLPERIDLATAADLHASLVAHAGAPLVIDAGETRQISTPAIQLFLSAAKTWRSNNHALDIENASPQMLEQLAIAGITLEDLTSQPEGASS